MGLDMTIRMVQNPIRKSIHEYEGIIPATTDFESEYDYDTGALREIYWRKFWGLHECIVRRHDRECHATEWYDNGIDILLSKDDIEAILQYVCHNEDYFGGFSNLPELAFILWHYDEYQQNGIFFIYNGNY